MMTTPPRSILISAGEASGDLYASLLVEECPWSETQIVIDQFKKRYDIRRRKQRVRQVSQAIAEAQALGNPALPALEQELRSLQREAEAVRELALMRPPQAGPPVSR